LFGRASAGINGESALGALRDTRVLFWNDEEEVKARARLSLTVGDAGFDERNVVVALQEDLMYHHTYVLRHTILIAKTSFQMGHLE
jgi:hypothetical protein